MTSIRHRLRRLAADSAAATLAGGQPGVERDGGRGQRVADLVRADQAQRDVGAAPVARAPAGTRRAPVVERARPRPARRRRRGAERDHPARAVRAAIAAHQRVVGVEHRDPVRRQRLDQLALGLRRSRSRDAELAEVRACRR